MGYGSSYGSGYGYGGGYGGEEGAHGAGAGMGYEGPGSTRRQAPQQLAYDGKMYLDWLQELRTERNPQRVLEGVKALAVLAPEAGSDDAAEVLIKVMRSYGVVEDQYGGNEEEKYVAQISQQIYFTLLRMEPEAVAKAIAREINDGNTNSRQFLTFLVTYLNQPQPAPAVKRLTTSLSNQAEQMVSSLHHLSLDENQNVSRWASGFAAVLTTSLKLEPGSYKTELNSILEKGLQSTDHDTLAYTAAALAQIAPDTEGLVEALVRLADVPGYRTLALTTLSELGTRASAAMPTLLQILDKAAERQTNAASGGEGEYGGMEAGSGYGGFPGGGAFGMGGMGMTNESREILQVLQALEKMDPKDVRQALPLIRSLAAESSPYRTEARKVLTMLGEMVD